LPKTGTGSTPGCALAGESETIAADMIILAG